MLLFTLGSSLLLCQYLTGVLETCKSSSTRTLFTFEFFDEYPFIFAEKNAGKSDWKAFLKVSIFTLNFLSLKESISSVIVGF